MLGILLRLLSFLGFIFVTAAAQNPPPYRPSEMILINCGASSDDASGDGRLWSGDVQSKFCPFNSQTSPASEAYQQDQSVDRVPYMTARIIHSKLTCTFPVLPGPKFIRLYFYPDTYSDLSASESFFTVTANNYTLLSNYSAYLAVSANKNQTGPYIFKEFIVTVWDNQELKLTFTPSPSSFAFINGIEIVSTPNGLYTRDMNNPYTLVNSDLNTAFQFDNATSLETVIRLNVGGQNVNDTGMFRTWREDSKYIFGGAYGTAHKWRDDVTIKYTKDTPAYTAPPAVYITKRSMGPEPRVNLNYNLTWHFPVDSGFKYLVRLHFCETDNFITDINQRVFFIFINNVTAEIEADVFHWSGGRDIPVYKDYVIDVPEGSPSNQDLWLALHPNIHSNPTYADAILNGIEIFKLNKSDGNLAGPNLELVVVPGPPEQRPNLEGRTRKESSHVVVIVGAVVGVVFAFALILYFSVYRPKSKAKDKSSILLFSYTSSCATIALPLPTDLCRKFTIAEIRAATRNFDDQTVIGSGGFGTVYKGYIESGSIPVAIKRLALSSKQGIREFHTEIEMLSKLRHLHLVSLIGYCDDQGEMILVYEYIPHGNLQDHLYKTKNPPLPWKQRLQICIGAARGLHYLHTGAKHSIIHRDVKSSNILLDRNWVAKVSDFGLSKTGPTGDGQTHVSTVVRGSFGYLDPEYYRRQQLTEKSDVYSFGVVLFEVLCARPPVVSSLPKEEVILVDWARKCYRRGALDQIIDPRLKGDIAAVSLNKFGEIADYCLRDTATERPTMGDAVWSLEFALQLQETAEKFVNGGDVFSESQIGSSVTQEVTTTDDDELFTLSGGPMSDSRSTVSTGEGSASNKLILSGTVFSQIMNPQGR
ncbi:hypothetical protein P3X46_029654 [Hevea brasiliensis]|uniref:Protein kinase domain-containing protein n=1 Tax=Hevea brasiliensis TaxID=3981 RepID=A0ABQ9KTD6_HEVBR|nr:receptor-like protein kinase FERONIA [Hevea brasiliensis]KAJ9147500.1 hypothetical protein P3X46_029654 [Hevea brasiliensis]